MSIASKPSNPLPDSTETLDIQLFRCLQTLSFKTGQFTLSSGQHATYYMDARLTTLSSEGSRLVGEWLFQQLYPFKLDAVGGMTMGADPMVTALTLTSALKGQPLDGFLVRKQAKGHGREQQIEGHLKAGFRVALLEDVISTGASTLKAIEALQREVPSVEIVKIIGLVDRSQGEYPLLKSTGIPVECLFSIEQFL
jgi:orotate phosphoribosyltransferase